MREIKFNAFHRPSKTMIKNVPTGTVLIFDDNSFNYESKDCDFLQDTGLKDKNGVGIFSGNLLTASGKLHKVEWSNKRGAWIVSNCDSHQNDYLAMVLSWSECEVIGNIYQNPELIK